MIEPDLKSSAVDVTACSSTPIRDVTSRPVSCAYAQAHEQMVRTDSPERTELPRHSALCTARLVMRSAVPRRRPPMASADDAAPCPNRSARFDGAIRVHGTCDTRLCAMRVSSYPALLLKEDVL